MHSALFVAIVPDEKWVTNSPASRPLWYAFTDIVDACIVKYNSVQRLSDSVWLVDISKAIPFLACLISTAEYQKIAYKILPLADEPQWLPVGSDPDTTLDPSART